MNDEFLEVIVKEVHHWPSCPCGSCSAERARRQSPSKRVLRMSVSAATLLGIIPSRQSDSGSFARDLMLKSGKDC